MSKSLGDPSETPRDDILTTPRYTIIFHPGKVGNKNIEIRFYGVRTVPPWTFPRPDTSPTDTSLTDTSPTDTSPMDISLTRHIPDRRL